MNVQFVCLALSCERTITVNGSASWCRAAVQAHGWVAVRDSSLEGLPLYACSAACRDRHWIELANATLAAGFAPRGALLA